MVSIQICKMMVIELMVGAKLGVPLTLQAVSQLFFSLFNQSVLI